MTVLELTLVLLAAAVIAVVVLRAFGSPPLVAYLAVGVLLGPHAAGLATDDKAVHGLGEIGVVFLMFSLGLEFSLARLRTLRSHVFGLGASQVGLTGLIAFALLLWLPTSWILHVVPGGLDWRGAFALGGALAMSSTALVSKLLTERRELETEHGKRVFSVLLFQDLAVIPLLIMIPALASGDEAWLSGLFLAVAKAVVLLMVLLRFGPPLMRAWFRLVAKQRSHEVFTLNVLLATLLFAWLTKRFGLSMELGAFIAGMLIAETEFRYQVEEDIKPFRDVLLGLFFVTIGMQLDIGVVVQAWLPVMLILIFSVLIKFALIFGLVRVLGGTQGIGIRTGIWLAQSGEFGLVLLGLASGTNLLSEQAIQPVLAAMLLSLLVSPILIAQANRIALRASSQEWLTRSLQIQKIASSSISRRGHVLIAGYGRSGQALAHVLESESIPYVALDLDPDRVREASAAGDSVVYGDATKTEALTAAGIHRACAMAITFDDRPAVFRLLDKIGNVAPALPVLVRSSTDSEMDRLRQAGATEVVPEIAEGSLMLASHALALAGVSREQVVRRVGEIRAGRYQLLQGFFHGADDSGLDDIESEHVHLHSISLAASSASIGKALGELPLDGVRIPVLTRRGKRILEPGGETRLEADDTVVICGTPDQIGAAETVLQTG